MAAECAPGTFIRLCKAEFVEGFKAYVNVAMLQELVIEILFSKIGIKSQQGAVFACSVGERGLSLSAFAAIFSNFLTCCFVVGF